MALRDIEALWADVMEHWGEEELHLRLLASAPDLEDLAEVGRRCRGVLASSPDDATALAFPDEVVKQASALALSALPRSAPPRELPPGVRRAALALVAAVGAGAVLWILLRMAPGFGGWR